MILFPMIITPHSTTMSSSIKSKLRRALRDCIYLIDHVTDGEFEAYCEEHADRLTENVRDFTNNIERDLSDELETNPVTIDEITCYCVEIIPFREEPTYQIRFSQRGLCCRYYDCSKELYRVFSEIHDGVIAENDVSDMLHNNVEFLSVKKRYINMLAIWS